MMTQNPNRKSIAEVILGLGKKTHEKKNP